jgi:PleD family two-component response regulator
VGHGSTFHFTIQLLAQEQSSAHSSPWLPKQLRDLPTGIATGNSSKLSPASTDIKKLRVLLAEDNAVNQIIAMRVLEKRGCVVTVAENGQAALQACATQTFDLILMDIQMPGMDGLQATAAIREKEIGTAASLHQKYIAPD